ncbi:MAG: hypothetical protein NC489_18450 [Ruminococcus flavefaciens]|nr:hypothetical protein [Ruminococcus flavefaciens]
MIVENTECIKDIIKFVSENVNVVIEGNDKFKVEITSLQKIIENLSSKEYDKQTIVSNFILCCKRHYIESTTPINNLNTSTSFSTCKVSDVTPSGYKFLEDNN